MIILGQGLYGRCDDVLGQLHVATRFFSVFFVPVVPLQGFIVLEERGDHFRGVQIPISVKSLFLAWLRALLWVPGLILVLLGMYNVYLLIADGRPPLPEALKLLGGGALLLVLAVASLRLGMKASFRRAVQLGLAAGIDRAELAARYGQLVPDAETLQVLLREIRPETEEGKPALGPVGRVMSFLLLAVPGGMLVLWGGYQLLARGYRGWATSFLWALPAFLGLLLVCGGLAALLRLRARTRDQLFWPVLAAVLLAGGLGPWLSKWSWQPREEKAWQEYVGEVEGALQADRGYEYGAPGIVPFALHRPAYFLVGLLARGQEPLGLRDPATLAWHGSDPHFQAVLKLADSMKPHMVEPWETREPTGPASWEVRRERLKAYLPVLKEGGWPDDLQ